MVMLKIVKIWTHFGKWLNSGQSLSIFFHAFFRIILGYVIKISKLKIKTSYPKSDSRITKKKPDLYHFETVII
jgi:hypothetical protein